MITIDIAVTEPTQVAEARRSVVQAAQEAGFDETAVGQAALVATELGTNLLKHGGGGRLLVGVAGSALEVLALDKGPGMADVDACMADGYSTAGTPGNGLGAVRRLAKEVHVASWPGRGTAVFARLCPGAAGPQEGEGGFSIQVPKPGEQACGDGWAMHEDDGGRTVFVVDGLGHGTEAAVAANAAIAQFRRSAGGSVTEIVQAVHQGMRHTRGGAVAVARIEWASATVAFAGLGNIAAAVLTPQGQVRRMVSHNGTAGHNARKIQAFDYPCGEGILVMHTDGIGTGWKPDDYPAMARLHPMLLAGILYRDFSRGRDDATVVACRTGRP
ncbi:MAG: anti-sigma regulatory factor [Aquabacterium sp.]|nr:MAG: anti-sigma regulatory factor [Aquabacterium sp.]